MLFHSRGARIHPVSGRRLARVSFALAVAACAALTGCEDDAPGVVPSQIEISGGDNQFSLKGTALPEPFTVRLRFADNIPAPGFDVDFDVIEGGGTMSSARVRTDGNGRASATLTLGSDVGMNRVRATIAANGGVSTVFTATAGNFYCPEEDPTLVRKYAPPGDLFLVTKKSGLHTGSGIQATGVVRIARGVGEFTATSVVEFETGVLDRVVRDGAFSSGGDFFVSWAFQGEELIKLALASTPPYEFFSPLDQRAFFGSELVMSPASVLFGVDDFGPFSVGCRDTLMRWEEASYDGATTLANNDALAIDPLTGDLLFIRLPDGMLMRLPLDGVDATGDAQDVVVLTEDEATGANGMVVDDEDGSIYILVETYEPGNTLGDVKSIVKVTSAGVKSTAVDFFARRGAGEAAGIQNDLAIDQRFSFIYTVDTLNDIVLLYDAIQDNLIELLPADPDTMGEAVSTADSEGERVGLAVLP